MTCTPTAIRDDNRQITKKIGIEARIAPGPPHTTWHAGPHQSVQFLGASLFPDLIETHETTLG